MTLRCVACGTACTRDEWDENDKQCDECYYEMPPEDDDDEEGDDLPVPELPLEMICEDCGCAVGDDEWQDFGGKCQRCWYTAEEG